MATVEKGQPQGPPLQVNDKIIFLHEKTPHRAPFAPNPSFFTEK